MFLKFTILRKCDTFLVLNPTIPLVCTMATKSVISPPPVKTDSDTTREAAREDGGKARSELSRDPEVTEVVGGRTAGCYRARVTVVTRVPQFIISILVTFIVLVEICLIFTQFL